MQKSQLRYASKLWIVSILLLVPTIFPLTLPAALAKSPLGKDNSNTGNTIEDLLTMQADAWNKGNLDKFMTGYLHSSETSYTSGGTIVSGYSALLERYRTRYGSKPETMGKLKFSDLKITSLGQKAALCVGHWHLERAAQPDLDGVFSLVLTRTPQGWKIIHDHSSQSTSATGSSKPEKKE